VGLELQLVVAAAVLAIGAALSGSLGALSLLPAVMPWWLLLGGVASPIYITAGILLFPRLGALVSVGLFVTGQMLTSLILDLCGTLGVPPRSWSVSIGLGALGILAGITIVVRGQRPARVGGGPGAATRAPASSAGTAVTVATAASARAASRAGWVVLGLVAGGVLPIQGAMNAQLRTRLGASLAVGTLSFAVATATIAVVLVVLVALRRTPVPRLAALGAMPWWGWLGGLCAAAYVTATFQLIPTVGAAITVALTVTGQQLASAAIDHHGWFRMARRPLGCSRGLGLVLLITGSVLVQLG
jgi:bacterial/archaeal transporter family-2 protein